MNFLELKVPPAVVGIAAAAGMWAAAHIPPAFHLSRVVRLSGSFALFVLGLAIAFAGVMAFRRASTTVNPLKPETSAVLVSTGVYSFTRNPMYLGMAMLLFAWAVFLSSIWALAGPVLFALYITRFQIVPEERALDGLFGALFADYKKRVRRWL